MTLWSVVVSHRSTALPCASRLAVPSDVRVPLSTAAMQPLPVTRRPVRPATWVTGKADTASHSDIGV
ncbi:hypothetical protein [Streptomyces sp. JW3]|uniref:hypothetical protein n=1 Tax=Streptomyces sp. JW3 TaxID=3456955 RepID=UPI003FA41973